MVVAAGRPGLVTGDMLKNGAVVVDVGINVVDGHIRGDVDFESARRVASAITPVPGGVGPIDQRTLADPPHPCGRATGRRALTQETR